MPETVAIQPPYNVIQPGAYSAVDATQLTNAAANRNRPLPAVLGVTKGGQPDTPLLFESSGELRNALRSGPGYDVARFCLDGGAPAVVVVRVGNSVAQGSISLATSVGTGHLVLTSIDYGTWVNSIEVSLASTGKLLTITYTDQFGNDFIESWDITGVGTNGSVLAEAVNGTLAGYNQSNYVTAVMNGTDGALVNASAAPLTGGTDGTAPAGGDWTNGLTALETETVDIVLAATGDASVHAQVQAHCANMSASNARRERTYVVGGVLGESVAATVTRVKDLADARGQLVYPGMWDYDLNGNLALFDPFYAAGKVAGMHCGLPDPATSLLHKQVPIIDVEVKLSTVQGGALDQLLYAGATPIAPADVSGFWVVDSLSTYQRADQIFRDFHKVRSADYVAQYARAKLEDEFVGGKRLSGTQAAIQVSSGQILEQLQNMQIITDYLAPTVAPGPNVNSWDVSLPVMLPEADKFIFIDVALQASSTIANTSGFTAQDALS